jgi:hypothetical protein
MTDAVTYLLAIAHVFWTVSVVQRIACLHWVQYIVDAITDRVKDYETDICMPPYNGTLLPTKAIDSHRRYPTSDHAPIIILHSSRRYGNPQQT